MARVAILRLLIRVLIFLQRAAYPDNVFDALLNYTLQLILNFLWPVIFFNMHTSLLRRHSAVSVSADFRGKCLWHSCISSEPPSNLFHRCCGPEANMTYHVDAEWFYIHVADLKKVLETNQDMPPLIAHYVEHDFELNDGNHRLEAYNQLQMEQQPELEFEEVSELTGANRGGFGSTGKN